MIETTEVALLPYQERVVSEKKELDERRDRLYDFIHSDTFDALKNAERDRLMRQAHYMDRYSAVLAQRIAAFETAP